MNGQQDACGEMAVSLHNLRLTPLNVAPEKDCYGDDREALSDFERFFNNSQCSDVSLLVGDEM